MMVDNNLGGVCLAKAILLGNFDQPFTEGPVSRCRSLWTFQSKADVERELKQEDHLVAHVARCIKYEALKRQAEDAGDSETPTKQMRLRDGASALGDVEVRVQKETSVNMEEECGNFWPLDLWKRHHPDAEEPTTSEMYELIIKVGSKPVRGLIREPSDGSAIGVVRLTNTSSIRALRDTTVARRSEGVEAGHVDDVFAAASARASISASTLSVEGAAHEEARHR